MQLITMILFLLVISVFQSVTFAKNGVVTGASIHQPPDWFKESFMDISDDVSEANKKNRHIILFFHLDGCPYCGEMFHDFDSVLKQDVQKNFDTIEINIKGDREVAFDAKTSMSEKELAIKLKVRYTPTLIFLNTKNQPVVRLNGYRSPRQMKYILAFVRDKKYLKTTLTAYLAKLKSNKKYPIRNNPLFKNIKDLSTIKQPLAVIFDAADCDNCTLFYDKTLKDKAVLKQAKKYIWVRLNANSNDTIINPDGEKTTPFKWVQKLKLTYRPGVLLFKNKQEIQRIDGELYHYHYSEILRFVSGGYYYNQSFGEYLKMRQAELLNSGINIDFSK